MDSSPLTRRKFVETSLAAGLLGAIRPLSRAQAQNEKQSSSYQLYWGDLHNHNAIGYGKGSLERSIEIAQEHLDFFAFTGHASWHDLPKMPGDRHMKWVNGFKVHSDHWKKTRGLIQEANNDTFAALLGYEWHSSQFGDYCMIFPDDQPDLYLPDHVEKLLKFSGEKNALAIPHHLAYARGWRGANFDHFKASASPVVEIFSEHGCSESVNAPGDFIRHSMGGRSTHNTVERQLAQGLRFGFVASTDDHRGYPGAYGEGLVAVWASDPSPAAIVDAVRKRRTYAITGDRIEVDFTLNDQAMGSELKATNDRQIDIKVSAPDSIKMIELIRNGRIIKRHFPEDSASLPAALPGQVQCRLRYGWGPWGDLSLGRICDWDMDIHLDGGHFVNAIPCFQSAPFDSKRRDRLRVVTPSHLKLESHTTRVKAFAEDPTKAIVLEIDAKRPDASLTIDLHSPTAEKLTTPLKDLQQDNQIHFTGTFTAESFSLQRLVAPSERSATIRWQDQRQDPKQAEYYYVRVQQHNGHMAWSSPIWVG
ncbi:MAG: DUF3604 domain-containing protein [Verrucomicrobiota bacterium]